MKNLLVLNVQSITDVITNSSSELFVLNTNTSLEDISKMLSTMTSGYLEPIIFTLEDYRKNIAEFRKLEEPIEEYRDSIDIDNDTLWNEYCDKRSALEEQYSYYLTVKGWFTDIEDEDSLCDYRMDYIRYPRRSCEYGEVYSSTFKDDIHYDYDEWRDSHEEYSTFDSWDQEIQVLNKEFFKQWEDSHRNQLPHWWNPKEKETIQGLDGKILLLSDGDNAIPYDDWGAIRSTFNAWNMHLG